MSTSAPSQPPPPPSGGGDDKKAPSSNPSTPKKPSKPPAFYQNGNGALLETSQWSSAYEREVQEDPEFRGYIVDRLGSSPRFVRENLTSARSYLDMSHHIFDGKNGAELFELSGNSTPAQLGTGRADQEVEEAHQAWDDEDRRASGSANEVPGLESDHGSSTDS